MAILTSVSGWKELVEGYSRDGENFSTNRTTRRYQTPWANRQQFINDVMGRIWNQGGTPLYKPPCTDPEFPWLYARTFKEVGIAPIGCDGNRTTIYKFANFDINFEILKGDGNGNNPGSVTYMEVSVDIASDVITMDRKFFWGADAPAGQTSKPLEGITAGINVPVQTITASIKNWYGAPVGAGIWEDNAGKVNSGSQRLLYGNYPSKTLLFCGAKVRQSYTNLGISGFDVDLIFKFRNHPNWCQKIANDGTSKNIHIGSDTGPPPYASIGFDILLP